MSVGVDDILTTPDVEHPAGIAVRGQGGRPERTGLGAAFRSHLSLCVTSIQMVLSISFGFCFVFLISFYCRHHVGTWSNSITCKGFSSLLNDVFLISSSRTWVLVKQQFNTVVLVNK